MTLSCHIFCKTKLNQPQTYQTHQRQAIFIQIYYYSKPAKFIRNIIKDESCLEKNYLKQLSYIANKLCLNKTVQESATRHHEYVTTMTVQIWIFFNFRRVENGVTRVKWEKLFMVAMVQWVMAMLVTKVAEETVIVITKLSDVSVLVHFD